MSSASLLKIKLLEDVGQGVSVWQTRLLPHYLHTSSSYTGHPDVRSSGVRSNLLASSAFLKKSCRIFPGKVTLRSIIFVRHLIQEMVMS